MGVLDQAKSRNVGVSEPTRTRYEDDVHAWAHEQVELLRQGRLQELDAFNIAEELLDVAGREYDKLESALAVVLLHLLKWDHQPQRRSWSWVNSVAEHRRRVARQLRKHPSLKSRLGEAVEEAYEDARGRCATETSIEAELLPWSCPYDWDEITTRETPWPHPQHAPER